MATRIIEFPVAGGGTVALNPDQVVSLTRAGNHCVVWMANQAHVDLALSYDDALEIITKPPEPEPEPPPEE